MEDEKESATKPIPKFNLWEKVILSGMLTGLGDLEGEIRGLEFSIHHQEFFYTVTTEIQSFWSQEKFIEKQEQ